ncbi:UvrABC system protein A [Quillaja saponaria]|uniref:UvrABC system protein A n=1 Tax=Quillaja saponaria TaxID=32244 RepID=A0AAD7LSU1_QUISA|nr:UvrABC system protein A [Quillaja saponaria]
MNPQTEKLVRRTTMVATITASYFLLTADYGPEPNVLDPIKKAILSAESSLKEYIFGAKKDSQESQMDSDHAKKHP